MTKPQFTRRSFLAVGAATAVVVAAPACAAASSKPTPNTSTRHTTRSATPTNDVTVTQGNASITVSLRAVQDVTAIDYTITNVGPIGDEFTVSTTDLNDGRQSRKLNYSLEPGDSDSAEVYGRLQHSFQVNVCQSDGTCFTVGPIGPASQTPSAARGITAGPAEPGPTP
jgi:hypothetical protein